MRLLKSELFLKIKNRKSPRPLNRAASADEANVQSIFWDEPDSIVSSPSTPNSSSLSSQSNINSTSSPNTTPSPATPTQQQQPNTPLSSGSGQIQQQQHHYHHTSGHKNSLKGTKLARRARSFKDDLFEKISLMRTPTNTLGRSHSPHSPRSKHAKPPPTAEEVAKSAQSLETHVKDISNALKHFRDVVIKQKYEVLPGNGTVILETIASMFAVIQSYSLNENSTVLLSATQRVYQSLGKLIKLCDDVMLWVKESEKRKSIEIKDEKLSKEQSKDDKKGCPFLNHDSVKDVVDSLEEAVRNLVTLAQQKLKEKEENVYKYGPNAIDSNSCAAPSPNHLMRPQIEVAGQRTSLPDITLTPKERDILEKTKSNPIRASHSTESILRDTSPPPKPPLPNKSNNPPPLPPKRRNQQPNPVNSTNISLISDLDCSSEFSLMNFGVDHLSVHSRSPDENSSQCSLDSALNHSREEEELKTLGLGTRLDENLLEDDVEKMLSIKSEISKGTQKSPIGTGGAVSPATVAAISAGLQNVAAATVLATVGVTNVADKTELRKSSNEPNRHSNESGFVSMKSCRTSTQSVSKRSSEFSVQSSSKSSTNSEIAFGTMETISGSGSGEFQFQQQQQQFHQHHQQQQHHHQQQQQQQQHFTTTNISKTFNSNAVEEFTSTTKIYSSTTSSSTSSIAADTNHLLGSSISPELYISQAVSSSSTASSALLLKANSLDIPPTATIDELSMIVTPPALPPKKRQQSQYDNSDEFDDGCHEMPELRSHHYQQQQQLMAQWQSKHHSLLEPRRPMTVTGSPGNFNITASCNTISMDGNCVGELPPPLPIKKKHILAYMEICQTTQHRHTMHAYNSTSRNISHSQTMNIVVPVSNDLSITHDDDDEHEQQQPQQLKTPPALPPKSYKQRKPTALPPTIITTPPPSPKPNNHMNSNNIDIESGQMNNVRHGRVLSGSQFGEIMTTVCEELNDLSEEDQMNLKHSHQLPNVLNKSTENQTAIEEDDEGIDVERSSDHRNFNNNIKEDCSQDKFPNLLEELDIMPYLVFKKENEDGPEVKGGYIDALIVHASRAQKVTDNAFSEAFITTFRTFIEPADVIEKLTHRYTVFFCQLNDQKQKAAKETFSLLVRVVNDLTPTDLTNELFKLLVEFVYQLVCSGKLYLVKLLRNKYIEKVNFCKLMLPFQPINHLNHDEVDHNNSSTGANLSILSHHHHNSNATTTKLLDLKSLDIAEQMTLLDAELFQKIEIPEVLLFAKEQCEEKSPNLKKFTEHFNNMSWWARSMILNLNDAKDREKHVIKFIKIMKHLRKMNNYNSYLALLSALDSAPIRRLEWHKTITESLKEYCTIIDSSSSFRVYRQALAETNPPCIPYIGLVLQDLTFVHVGNPDYLKESVINFSKRWQQHNIIVNMKRFKQGPSYPFQPNERIIEFFGNFKNFLSEDELWIKSEKIKPRGKRQT